MLKSNLEKDIQNIPYCNCSPVFTDNIMDKIKTSLGSTYKIQNRAGLQKELYLEKDTERRKQIIDRFQNICNWNESGFENVAGLINSTSDEDDILVVKDNDGGIKGFAKVEKANLQSDPNSYDLILLCSNTPNVGSFLLASYMLALKHLKAKCGYLSVSGGHQNLAALCLYDKFGFVEDVDAIKSSSELEMKVVLANKSKSDIINTYKKTGTRKIKKTEPLCSPEFKRLDQNDNRVRWRYPMP